MPIDESTTEGYEIMAAENDDWNDESHRRHLEWPAIRLLFSDLDGLCVLEACHWTDDNTRYFGEIIAADATEAAIERTRERFTDDPGTVYHADLTEPLVFLDDDTVDLVVSQLVLEHISDWRPVFDEFARVLQADSRFAFSTGNSASNEYNRRIPGTTSRPRGSPKTGARCSLGTTVAL